jgi:hypothetical protein
VADLGPDTTGPSVPGSHPTTERLRAYLADDLAPDAAQAVGDHLDSCPHCVDALDDLEGPPVLTETKPTDAPAWDERRMRRSVRRTLLRTAFNAALLLLVAVIVVQLLGWYVVHPLLVDRGDRAPDSVAASIDVPVLTIPGAEVGMMTSHPGVVRRTTDVSLQRAVGARMVPLGTFTTRLGPLGMSLPESRQIGPTGPWLEPQVTSEQQPVPFDPDRLGDGMAVTVELRWREPVDLAAADAVAAGTDDLSLLWVGFRVPGADEPVEDPSWRLGYSACGGIPDHIGEQRGAGFGGDGFRMWDRPRGAAHALAEVRRATANLADLGWPGDGTTAYGALADPATTAEAMASTEPGVTTVVVTGPTQEVAAAVEEHAPDQADLLELDFDRGAPEPCA